MNKSSYPSFFCTGILLGYTMYERDELFPLKDNGTSLLAVITVIIPLSKNHQ